MVPSGSDEPALENVIGRGAGPEVVLAEATAVGGTLAGAATEIVTLALPAMPSLSVTVRTAMNVPADA